MARVGTIIDNKYEILKEVGRGGMSVVYLAMDRRLNKQWAVKEITKIANDKNNEVVVQSLLIEANMMKKLDHPSLPRIVDIIDNGRTIYVIMDYIEGESLDKILKNGGAQPQELVIEWAKQLCNVLRYLHSQNPPIIYRDMKPANVMLKPEGTLKVIDFGIAREYKEHNLEDTVSLGTKGYAAPEQFGGKGQTDARTDIYCLGVTLYHLITGQNPCEPPYELYPIRQWNPTLSSGLEYIIQKCTQLNPMDRYQNCDELMYALEHYSEIDDIYKNKQKKKVIAFAVVLGLSVIMLIAGFLFDHLFTLQKDENYEIKVNISDSTGYEQKVDSYIEAIDLYPERYEAYIKLLEAYSDNNKFGNEESQQFMNYYNASFSGNKLTEINTADEGFAELNYNAGITYFYLYNENDTNVTLKDKALKAYSFFENVVSYSNDEYINYSICESYFIVCDFYKNYVSNATNTKEPSYEIYYELLNSLDKCITNLDEYDYDDLPYIKLTVYEAVCDLLNEQRKGFAVTGISQDMVLGLMENIFVETKDLAVTQEKSINKQNSILSKEEEYIRNITITYENTEER